MQMTSIYLKPYGNSAQELLSPPCASACPPHCQLNRMKGGAISQVKSRRRATCNPKCFTTAPFYPFSPHCNLPAKAHLKHFQLADLPWRGFSVPGGISSWKITVIQPWSGGEIFSQSTGDRHLATCSAWFRSGAWPWFYHVLDGWPNHWTIKAITSALWPY